MRGPDLRAEGELTWRFQHADDEAQAGAVRSLWRESLYLGSVRHAGPLRCGPVYVRPPAPPYREPAVLPDRRALDVLARAKAIDGALRRLHPEPRARLRLAFGMPVSVLRLGLWPIPLVACARLSSMRHRESGSTRSLEAWLSRLAAKAGTSLAFELEEAATLVVEADSKAYCDVRFR